MNKSASPWNMETNDAYFPSQETVGIPRYQAAQG